MTKTTKKTLSGDAHFYIAHIREWPPRTCGGNSRQTVSHIAVRLTDRRDQNKCSNTWNWCIEKMARNIFFCPVTYISWLRTRNASLYMKDQVVRPKKHHQFRRERDSNPWLLRYQYSSVPREFSTNWELVTLRARNIPVDEECKWIHVYERSYTWTSEKYTMWRHGLREQHKFPRSLANFYLQ